MKKILRSIVLSLLFWGLSTDLVLSESVVLDKNSVEKPDVIIDSQKKTISGSLLINDTETLANLIEEQKKHDVKDLEKLWQGTVENNQVIEGLKSGINQYLTTVNTNITALYQGAQSLNTEYAKLDTGIKSLAVSVQQLADGVNQLVSEYGKLDKGVNEYTEGVAKVIAGYSQIVTGTSDLLSGSGELSDGTAELVNSIAELYDGTSQLKDGTGEMRDETDGMDTQITDKIDEMVNGITGGNYELVSFVSEKNTNVKAVQFVIQTESVQIKEADEATPVVEEKLNFWQKVLKLFGID